MQLRQSLIAAISALGLLLPAGALAAPKPIDPLEVAQSEQIFNVAPHVSPTGEQLTTFSTQVPGGTAFRLIERTDGGPFSAPVDLGTTGNVQDPSLSFTPTGGIYAVWGIPTSGATAQQTFRPAGGEFVPASDVTGCGRFVDSAASPTGGIAVSCTQTAVTNPPDTYGLGISPTLGPVTVNETMNQPIYDPFIDLNMTWGSDGTLAVVGGFQQNFTNPPPANETRRTRVTLRNAGTGLTATADFDATEPNELESVGDPAVLNDGTVALATFGTAGARVLIRPPGALTTFAPFDLTGVGVASVKSDDSGNIHALHADPEPPTREYWTSVKPPGGNFGSTAPIPLAGGVDPYIPFGAFEVAPDGTEYALIRDDDGLYATSRDPGAVAFSAPVKLGPAPADNPTGAVTPDGDLLVAWPAQNGPGDYGAYVGGLDRTPPKVTVGSFPVEGADGQQLSFAASATDSMGMRSTGWDFGGGQTVAGDTASHAFGPGDHRVSFRAVDRAGNETVETRTVSIPGDGAGQGGTNMRLVTPKKMKFRALLRKGVKVRVRASEPMRIKATIGTAKRNGKLKSFRTKKIRRLKASHDFRVKPKRKRLGKPRKLKLTVRVTGTTATGKRVTKARRVKIRP